MQSVDVWDCFRTMRTGLTSNEDHQMPDGFVVTCKGFIPHLSIRHSFPGTPSSCRYNVYTPARNAAWRIHPNARYARIEHNPIYHTIHHRSIVNWTVTSHFTPAPFPYPPPRRFLIKKLRRSRSFWSETSSPRTRSFRFAIQSP